MQPDHPHEADIFARIAVQRLSDRHQRLAEPEPAPVPDTDLPVRRRGRAVDWPAPPAITSAAELRAELDRSLKRHQPFLRELAPELESTRLRKPVWRFDWRVESPQDRADFASTLAGAGDWQRVTLPHFGPPLGRAVTFYRTGVKLGRRMLGRGALFLCFRGVDYACQVYLNGVCLGRHEGFFAPFEFDCTAHARVGDNTLLVRVENDAPMMDHGGGVGHCGDKIYAASGPGYDDPELGWHHCPPGMGIYQEVAFEARPRLFVSDAWVRTLDLGDGAGAPATVEAWLEITNCDLDVKPVELELSVFGRNFRRTAVRGRRVVPHSTQIRGHGDVDQFNVPSVRQHMGPGVNYLRIPLEIPAARVWEPDRPWLYQLQLRLLDGGGREVDTAAETLPLDDIFQLFIMMLSFNAMLGAAFWLGMTWRRATRPAAWLSILVTFLFTLALPFLVPLIPGVRTSPALAKQTRGYTVENAYTASPADVGQRAREIAVWETLDARGAAGGPRPAPLAVGDPFTKHDYLEPQSIFWQKGLERNAAGPPAGAGLLKVELVALDLLGFDLTRNKHALNESLTAILRVVVPFGILILVSLATRREDKARLDFFFARMRTTVNADHAADDAEVARTRADPSIRDHLKLFPDSDWEFRKWTPRDWKGQAMVVAAAAGVVLLLWALVGLGASNS